MTEIEQKALALVNEVRMERGCDALNLLGDDTTCEALCRAVEQHEAFRQEVSDAIEEARFYTVTVEHQEHFDEIMSSFIIAKPDPLVEVLKDLSWGREPAAADLRAALDACGFEIREKGQ